MTDFDAFWGLYPRHIAKKDAERAWARLKPDQRFAAIQSMPVHIRYWEAAGTTKEYLPYPATWINGERWTDELEMPKAEGEWWRSTAGIRAKAEELGMWPPKLGEDWHSLKARILAKKAA